ncbi:MAG: hypothetical protein JSR21_21630 [Proteobacteria bacterium]|nr:hypothetical protein [Pseudomonadota bacterium]
MLRVTVGRAVPATLPDAAARALLRAAAAADANAVDLPQLQATLDATAETVRALFVRHVGEPRMGETRASEIRTGEMKA